MRLTASLVARLVNVLPGNTALLCIAGMWAEICFCIFLVQFTFCTFIYGIILKFLYWLTHIATYHSEEDRGQMTSTRNHDNPCCASMANLVAALLIT